MASLVPRHIQDMDTAESLVPYWGYADRVMPCTNDPGSCEYLDVVYGAHAIGMRYMGIIWLTIGGIILVWAMTKHLGRPDSVSTSIAMDGGLRKVRHAMASFTRRYLLPDAVRVIFGRTTRFQVFTLCALTAYLTIFTFAGITTWRASTTRRTSLGPWSDRIGVIAYALTPLSILLASRESILSLLLGVPYQSFNFLHRWTGYLIFVQSALHTIGWCIIEIRLYQPQPKVGLGWIVQTYMVWGLVAMLLLTILFLLSTPWGIRMTGYETFRKLHYVLAMVYIGACWGHWAQLKCFLLPALIFWFMDRGARLIRSAFLHYHRLPCGNMGFRACESTITLFPDPEAGDLVRLDLENDQDAWPVGHHFYLTFTECSIWQSHPFTPLNAPVVRNGKVRHSYILRAKGGETKKVAQLAAKKVAAGAKPTTPVILTGPYGEQNMLDVNPSTNIICVAGGTGIAYVLPVLLELARQAISPNRRVELIWAMRHASNTAWVQEELDLLHKVSKALNLKVRLFATRDMTPGSASSNASIKGNDEKKTDSKEVGGVTTQAVGSASSSSSDEIGCDCGDATPVRKTGGADFDVERHPDLTKLVNDFVNATSSGSTTVFASGPGGMISDLRSIVAQCNDGGKVWAGEERFDVKLVCDDRLEW
ncbi:ferric reductase like transmembrane component-domain-containing protein [Emericellopsis atlantica]|uniref:Ferric reductase like transmembrane component-domain-containing protein n=1 Tax=Emericellopsis atlantica TaxID=2614577 RepID=A0A9P7ZGF0_9HYPO|nr:ferric reductase like transmembrane component-domain-containing protein [Emericellopsis atlantica]KAG9251347.1 ferric reductase like transmembrane component-domain-containing protein [Emericellopsis atlantica]